MILPTILYGNLAIGILSNCIICDSPMLGRKKKLCSDECKSIRQKQQIKESQDRIKIGIRKNKLHKPHKPHKPHKRKKREFYRIVYLNCQVCDKFCARALSTGGNKFCSDKCNQLWNNRSDWMPETKTCIGCRNQFIQKQPNQVSCTKYCNRKMHDNSKSSKRRLAVGEFKYFDATIVFERDGWHCRLCGVETPKELRGKFESNAPTIDHIIPLSKGGPHTIRNSQCACRKCNSSKGAKIQIDDPNLIAFLKGKQNEAPTHSHKIP